MFQNHATHGKTINQQPILTTRGTLPYSPELGRFLSRDPIEERSGSNLHAFVNNNSIMYADELGLKISVANTEYWTLAQINAFSGMSALTIDANNPQPAPADKLEVRGSIVFDRKIEYGQCCIKLKKAPELYAKIRIILPSDWGNPTLGRDGKYFSMSHSGYTAVVAHEFRRRDAYLEASKVLLEPIELEGSQITKCGWYCANSASKLQEYQEKLENYVIKLQDQAKMEYESYLFGKRNRASPGMQGAISLEGKIGYGNWHYNINGETVVGNYLTGLVPAQHIKASVVWGTECPKK